MSRFSALASRALACIGLCLSPGLALAGNGLNDIGYGTQSEGMAGADLAVTDDSAALNINPAGLTQIANKQAYGDFEPFDYFGNRHRDQFGNDRKVSKQLNAVISGGYAQRIPGSNLSAGIGLFAQGGAGYSYDKLQTAFGTRDDLSSTFGSFKLAPGLAWKVSDELSVGAVLGIVYSQARQKFFPDTSVAAPDGGTPFYGFRLDGLAGVSFNGKVGFQYRPDPQWVIAAAYTSKTPIRLKSGSAVFDYDAAGLGRVKYRNASLSGLAIAQEAGIGVAFRPSKSWLVSTEVNWVDWSGALKSSTLHLSNADNAQAPQKLDLVSALNWRDQYVIAAGAAYQWNDQTTLRFGANYGRNPIPNQTTNPLLALTSNRSFTVGYAYRFASQWELSAAALYAPRVNIVYTNPQLPFGTNALERWDAGLLQLVISRRW